MFEVEGGRVLCSGGVVVQCLAIWSWCGLGALPKHVDLNYSIASLIYLPHLRSLSLSVVNIYVWYFLFYALLF